MNTTRKPYHLEIAPLPLERFLWDRERSRLSAEASTLELPPGDDWLQQMYSDAADCGIAIANKKTGITHRFIFVELIRSRDGDEVLGWKFQSEQANCPVTTVTIWND